VVTTRFEFSSERWIEAMRCIIYDEIDNALLGDVEYSQSEEFTDPPEHLCRDGASTIGYSILVADGRVHVIDRPLVDVSFHVVGDYALMAEVARTPFGATGLPPQVAQRLGRAVDEGTVRIHGERSGFPEALDRLGLHDRMAPLTW
jgi:hypothetical protein